MSKGTKFPKKILKTTNFERKFFSTPIKDNRAKKSYRFFSIQVALDWGGGKSIYA